MRFIIKGIVFFFVFVSSTSAYALDIRGKVEDAASFDELLKSGRVAGRVYFDLKTSSLDEKAKKDLNRIAEELLKLKASFLIRLEGYADSSLEKKDSVLLSIQRAQAVKLYMSRMFPGLKVDLYMTGFGETKPVISGDGMSSEEIMQKDRRVEIVVYSGASFFAEPSGMKVVGKLGDKKVKVKKEVPPVVTVSVVRRKKGLLVYTKSFKRYIIPDIFFDDDGLLKATARSVLTDVIGKVKDDSKWIFLAGRESYKGQKNWVSSERLKKQVLVANELIYHQGVSPERLFVQGIDSSAVPYGSHERSEGAVYLYMPVQ